jgi:hypothetical protein
VPQLMAPASATTPRRADWPLVAYSCAAGVVTSAAAGLTAAMLSGVDAVVRLVVVAGVAVITVRVAGNQAERAIRLAEAAGRRAAGRADRS